MISSPMDIAVSFGAGVPVFTLAGRFDGTGAVAFDAQTSALKTDAIHWVIDCAQVSYLSSLGIRSLISLEQRLRARGGGLVLAGVVPLVRQVFQVSRLDGLLRIVTTAPEAIEKARAAASISAVTEITGSRCRAKVRRLSGTDSTLEWWAPGAADGSNDQLLSLSAGDLGVAFGVGTLGAPGAAGEPGPIVSTPQFTAVLGAAAGGVTDFMVGDVSQVVPISVASAWGLSGAPAAIVELESSSSFSLVDALDELSDRILGGPAPVAVLGFVALGHTQDTHPGVFVTAIAFVPVAARTAIDREMRLEATPDPITLPSGRRIVGGAITLHTRPSVDGSSDLQEALSAQATLDTLGGIVGLADCAPVTNALVWVFAPREVRSGAAKLLQVTVEGDGDWRLEWDAIIRRLYGDCRSVTLTPLHGGFMSSTFKAVAYDHDGRRTLPSVVKIGPTAVTRREVEANRNYVSRFILNNGTTVLGDAEHGEWAGLRYNFLGVNGPDSRLVWLYDHYLQRPVGEVTALLERLFTRVLKPWYAQPKWEQVFLFRDHTPLRLFPTLFETAEQVLGLSADASEFDCHELGIRLPNPFWFLKREYSKREGESRLWYTAICHGDLNLRNVLVDERDNLYVIDFSETRPRNVVSDFARLEPVLKFEMTRPDTDEEVRRLVVFEEALTSVTALDQAPPFRYDGNDPLVARAHAGITLLRRCADRATLFETDMVPYWLALLEWTYPTVCYRQLSARQKRWAACSAALICRSILQLEGRA
jgi:anti-anti-sigma factor